MQAGGQVLYLQMNEAYGAYAQAAEQLGSSQSKGLANFLTGNLFEYEAAVNPKGAVPCAQNPYTGALTVNAACTITYPPSPPSFARSDRYHDWAAYAQDQWKVTSQFTLDYGVRYEYFGVQHNDNPNLDSNFYYGPGSSLPAQIRSGSVLTVPQSPIKSLWNPGFGNVSPRVGFAYDVFGNGKTSFRAGYGISYERNFGNITFNLIQNPPNYAVVVNNTNATVTSSNTIPTPATGTTGGLPPTSLRHVDQNIKTAQTQFHSASIDQQSRPQFSSSRSPITARVVSTSTTSRTTTFPAAAICIWATRSPWEGTPALTYLNPQFKNDNNRGSNGDSYYNGVNVQLNARDIHHSGLSLIANYTFAHSLDDLSTAFSEDAAGNFELGYTNAFDPGLDHGSSDFDVRKSPSL